MKIRKILSTIDPFKHSIINSSERNDIQGKDSVDIYNNESLNSHLNYYV